MVVVEGVAAVIADEREILERLDARLLGFMGAWNGVLAFLFTSIFFIFFFFFWVWGEFSPCLGVVNCGS